MCKLTDLTHSTIRFWEEKFSGLRPARSSGGHRYYTTEQVELLQYLKKLIYNEGYTIEGAKKRLTAEKIARKKQKINKKIEEKDVIQIAKTELKDILQLLSKKL